MKRITYSGGSLVTGDAVTAALLEYVTSVSDAESNVTVDIPVLEEDGDITVHTLLVGATTQFDVSDANPVDDEAARFAVPDLPQVGVTAIVETSERSSRSAEQIDELMQEIDDGLGS